MKLVPDTPQTLVELLDAAATLHADAPALVGDDAPSCSFAQLSQRVDRLGALLRQAGVRRDDRVAVVLPNGPAMAVAFLGTAAHAVCAPLNPGFREPEFRFYLEDVQARHVLLSRDERGPIRSVIEAMSLTTLEIEQIDDAADPTDPTDPTEPAGGLARAAGPQAHDVALLLHTSGTTARPKVVPLSHGNLAYSATRIGRHLALGPQDLCLNVMPLFHIHGLVGVLLASLARGAGVVCTAGFDEERFFAQIARFRPTWYSAVPTIHQRVVALGRHYRETAPGHRFRFVRSSSASLPPAVFEALESLTGAPVIEAYGMTEASHQMSSNPLPPGERLAGSVGPAAGAEIAIMDDDGRMLEAGCIGQIVIRGPGVITGYLDNPGANAQAFRDGWFLTGDQGRLDAAGRLQITGRLKELVNRGGEKIAPLEVDAALLACPDVAQAVAFAAPHPTLGEDLVAAVVLSPGVTLEEQALRERLFGCLAAHKVPSRIRQVAAIPKGPTGKVQRLSLFEQLAGAFADAGPPPQSPLEIGLAQLLGDVLGRAVVGMDENFFWLGGDSLSGARVVGRINERYGIDLPAAALFRRPTLCGLAPVVAAAVAEREAAEAALVADIDAMSDDEVDAMLNSSAHADG